MSDAVSALKGASFDGLVRVEECGLQGMITLRGDLSNRAVAKAATSVSGQKMPGQNRANVAGESGICWMSPDELLVLVPYSEAGAAVEKMTATLGKVHSLAVNVSDARAVFRLSGPAARDVLAKLCPVDLSPEAFGPGQFRRTRLAQVPAAFWMDDAETFRIVCFRSVAQYVFDLLKAAAHPAAAVGYHTSVGG
ncbi:sarcosine oxidase subunit gamma [Jhaorihella thermophila]|uniref:Sarcosine oxidase subunit gamma n=1 Tax=Jhaorihella thermophila TaxID=488547 RepID=A0A1H5RVB2_9RHOB|nr:sarcosine oxidase subunit gamma family protein [Jhaorihella thermophila]SEF41638.1 sarcosine oxidase subunit gamma [Jhaorihella thermophila]